MRSFKVNTVEIASQLSILSDTKRDRWLEYDRMEVSTEDRCLETDVASSNKKVKMTVRS